MWFYKCYTMRLAACCVLALAALHGCSGGEKGVLVAVNQYVHHPNLDATYAGFREVVDDWAARKNQKVVYELQIANGDVSVANQIARQQVAKKPALVLALATPSAQASIKATSTVPVIFGAITDPVAAGLVESMERPGANATGSSDRWPYERQFDLIRRLRPDAKTIGIVLNPGEANTVASMTLIDPILQGLGFRKAEAPVSNTSEVFAAAQSLAGRCDVFYAPADNTVLSGLDAFVKVAETKKIPLFAGDEGSVRKGAAATYGINYEDLGRETGRLAVRVLEGASPGDLPVAVGTAGRLIVNLDAAGRQGLTFSQEQLQEAIVVGQQDDS